jgi:predicted transposase/invertase (TIGR01784 family)
MTALLQGHPFVGQAYEKHQQFNRDERMRALDEAHQRFLHDLTTDIEEAHEKGEAKGIAIGEAKGKAEGKAEEKTDIARNMKSEGFNVDVISKMTGLSFDIIERLN